MSPRQRDPEHVIPVRGLFGFIKGIGAAVIGIVVRGTEWKKRREEGRSPYTGKKYRYRCPRYPVCSFIYDTPEEAADCCRDL